MKKNSHIDTKVSADPALFKPLKTSVTIRIDADVLAWFKSQGAGHLTRMNAALRDAMLRSKISEKD